MSRFTNFMRKFAAVALGKTEQEMLIIENTIKRQALLDAGGDRRKAARLVWERLREAHRKK